MIPVGFGYGEQSMSDPFQPFVSRAPNGFAGGIGNPMQDAFQRFLAAQGQGTGNTPSMSRDPFRRSDEGIPLWMQLGQPNPNQPVGFAGGVGMSAIGDYSMYAPEYRPGGQPPQPSGGRGFDFNFDPTQPRTQPSTGGGTGMPPIGQPPQPSGGRGFDFSFDPTQPRISGGPVSDPMQPITQPPASGGLPYNNGFYNPPNRIQQPMAMKKGGFAVKPVWDKKRPKDLGKPKDLSAKKEKSAKARAKAAGRPYPNLIDNMAVARKKGK